MKALFILNAAPHGNEVTYNGLRLAAALAKREYNQVKLYLMGDAVFTAKRGQMVPEGQAKVLATLERVAATAQANVKVCAGCMDARGLQENELIDGTQRGTLDELADWSEAADKVFVF